MKIRISPEMKQEDISLLESAEKGLILGVKGALQKGANPNAEDSEGQSALILAAGSNKAECLRFLIESVGVDVNHRDKNGWTALIHSAWINGWECVKTLIEAKADVNSKSNDGFTALMSAAGMESRESLSLLIHAGADLDGSIELENTTALMRAARYGRLDCVKMLVEAGAETDKVDFWGRTAEKIAAEKKLLNISSWLAGFSRASAEKERLATSVGSEPDVDGGGRTFRSGSKL